ncbi:hypothetical protein PV327_011123, partial [Microctonus hyperodae]
MVLSSRKSKSDFDTENVDEKSGKNANNISRTPTRTRKVSDSNDCLNLDEEVEKSREHLTPEKLFSSGKYQAARKDLHSSVPGNLTGTGNTASLSKIMVKNEFESAFKIIYINCME